MVGWQRHLQSILRQAGKRYQQNRTVPFNSSFHSKATPVLGEVPYLPSLWNTLSPSISRPLYQYLQHLRLSSSRTLLADDATPISSPLTPLLTSSTSSTEAEKAISKPSKVQAVLKGIKQSPKKVNLVAALVRGMRVEDALLQLQVTVKRASKTIYQVRQLQI
ncbi:hypothetical protein R3W88_007801 [Solanum pinnatisectum]|uniref:50S ribosomal protein L22, chloroplastic n=1 Tax=Solanum pinnatisectum TaxID=50273 RepID=A0AAV9M664_9SOLN|nr:hypothetical protein R3W88_007801 [Solanum pinnatisectum]